MEVDGIAEPVAVAEAAGPLLDALDTAVHAFGMAVVQVQDDDIEQAPQVAIVTASALIGVRRQRKAQPSQRFQAFIVQVLFR